MYADHLFQGDRSITTYARFAVTLDSTSDYFFAHLTQSEYCNDAEDIPNRVYSTIPWIVKRELGDEIS